MTLVALPWNIDSVVISFSPLLVNTCLFSTIYYLYFFQFILLVIIIFLYFIVLFFNLHFICVFYASLIIGPALVTQQLTAQGFALKGHRTGPAGCLNGVYCSHLRCSVLLVTALYCSLLCYAL